MRSSATRLHLGLTAVAALCLLLSACLPDPRTEAQLAKQLAAAQTQADGGGGASDATGKVVKCSSGDLATITKDHKSVFQLIATCLTEEWVLGCSPTAVCVGKCLNEQGTSKDCQSCMGTTAGQCVQSHCKTPCSVGKPKSVCEKCLVDKCMNPAKLCLP